MAASSAPCDDYEKASARAPRDPSNRTAREWNTVAKPYFQSDLSNLVGWYVVISLYHTVSYEVNAFPFQYALNRLNILLILAGNTNATPDLAITVLKNFKLKRDTIQTENDVPAR